MGRSFALDVPGSLIIVIDVLRSGAYYQIRAQQHNRDDDGDDDQNGQHSM